MRIIKEGIKPTYEWTTTCKHCGCVFVYDELDIVEDDFGDEFVECPTCGEEIIYGDGTPSRKN